VKLKQGEIRKLFSSKIIPATHGYRELWDDNGEQCREGHEVIAWRVDTYMVGDGYEADITLRTECVPITAMGGPCDGGIGVRAPDGQCLMWYGNCDAYQIKRAEFKEKMAVMSGEKK
jgi:hypothetical protein